MDHSEQEAHGAHYEALASMLSTWTFLAIFGFFNVSLLLTIIVRYGVNMSSLSFESSNYTLLVCLVPSSPYYSVEHLLHLLPAHPRP